MSCHADRNAGSLPSSGGDQTQTSPFTGSDLTPINLEIDATAWSSAGHNRPSGTFPGSPVSCVGDGSNGCHASGHGTESNKLLASWNASGTPPPAEAPPLSPTNFCYVCHDSDGPSSKNIEAQFNTATDYQGTVGSLKFNQRHDITAADQSYSGGVVSCKDCHSVHIDNAGAPVADPDNGSALATYSPTGSYVEDDPVDGDDSFDYNGGGDSDPINPEGSAGGFSEPDYIEFCLTCHDGTAPAGVTLTPMLNIALSWGAGGNQHGGGDGSTGSKTSKGGLKAPYVNASDDAANNDPANNYAAMNCNTCHGAHGSPNIYNLRESITVAGVVMTVGGKDPGTLDEPHYDGNSTYTLPEIGGTQTDHYWGAWCTFCHKMDGHPDKVETDACQGPHMHGGGAF
jgi:hypothetical protein